MLRRHSLGAVLIAAATALAACGSSTTPPTGSSGAATCSVPAGAGADGGGASLKIGQKGFTEEKLLAQIAKLALEKHNFHVDASTTAADPAIGQAIRNDQIQLLWQYTGTELGAQYLNAPSIPSDLHQAFIQVQQADAAHGLCWIAETSFNDTNGIGIRAADAARFGTTLSSFTTYLQSHSNVRICFASEFRTRSDGLPGLASKYGSVWASYPGLQDTSAAGETLLVSKQCDAAAIFTTDATIPADHLLALKDDKGLFPADNAGLMVRAATLQKYPAIATIMNPVGAKLTQSAVVEMDAAVDVQHQSIAAVAQNFLTQNGF